LLGSYGVSLLVLHEEAEQSAEQELMADFMSLIACFSGRVYGHRSAATRKRLLAEAQ
jgi:predicted site-specific integrase-resolvase